MDKIEFHFNSFGRNWFVGQGRRDSGTINMQIITIFQSLQLLLLLLRYLSHWVKVERESLLVVVIDDRQYDKWQLTIVSSSYSIKAFCPKSAKSAKSVPINVDSQHKLCYNLWIITDKMVNNKLLWVVTLSENA